MTTLKSILILYTSLIVKEFSIHRLANISGETLPCYIAVPSVKHQKYHLIEFIYQPRLGYHLKNKSF